MDILKKNLKLKLFNDILCIQIDRLAQAKYQDNLEFAQWMKRFFDLNCKEKGKDYEPLKRR